MIIHPPPRCPRIWLFTRLSPNPTNTLALRTRSTRLQHPQYSNLAESRPLSHNDDWVVKPPTCWTILTSSSEEAWHLQPSRQDGVHRKTRPGQVPLVLLLVTQAHVRLLNEDVGFIPRIIKSCLRPKLDQEVDVLAAVVDRIPFPPASSPVDNGELDSKNFSRQQCPEGSQGVSVALLDSSQLAPNVWDEQPISSKTDSSLMGAQTTSTLSFCFARLDGKSQTIHMPLANTIFQNNKLSTLFIRRYIKRDLAITSSGMDSIRERSLEHQRVIMLDFSSSKHVDFTKWVSSRLTPVTPPRDVAAAVGNIIRQISDQNDRLSPASHELESTINSAIGDGRLDQGLVEVWALLRPRRDEMKRNEVETSFDFEAELTKGARLLKVLSGGGGWGVKQGLLALDPDIHGHQSSDDSTHSNQEYTPQAKLFEDIVRTDDTVTFLVNGLINSSVTSASENQPSPVDIRPGAALGDIMVEFGSIPSTIDDIPARRGASQLPNVLNGMLIERYFGMLSEHGMNMTTSDMPQHPEERMGNTNLPIMLGHTTKLDAPYIMITMQSKTDQSEHYDVAEALPSESESTNNNAADDYIHEANDRTLRRVEAAYRAEKLAAVALKSQSTSPPKHQGAQVIQSLPKHKPAPAARPRERKDVRYTLSDLDYDSRGKQGRENNRGADSGFQLTKYLALPRSNKGESLEKAQRAYRKSSRLRDNEALQILYKEQLSQGATTAEALAHIERIKEDSSIPGEALDKNLDRRQLRISKHASLSETGKAMERHERDQLTSWKSAP